MFTVLEIVLVGGNTIGSQNTNTDANEITNKLRLSFHHHHLPIVQKVVPLLSCHNSRRGSGLVSALGEIG